MAPIADGTPRPAGNGFAVASDDAIVYYAPTGGAAGTTPAPQTGTESTQLVTKCGKAPEMTPVQYRTDTVGLVVRMELLGGARAGTSCPATLCGCRSQERATHRRRRFRRFLCADLLAAERCDGHILRWSTSSLSPSEFLASAERDRKRIGT